jgi:DnaK suppressor protein
LRGARSIDRRQGVAIFEATVMTVGETPNAAGLNAAQLAILREHLERQRAELRARLERDQEVARQAEPLIEPLEVAEQTREQDDAVRLVDRDRARLREIEDALGRIDAGTYGISEISGEPISFDRLFAVPWARFDSDEEP